jgi:putative Holliday junction resolvase
LKLAVQEKETLNPPEVTDLFAVPDKGRILALDPGTKRVGVGVCDELRVTTRPLDVITLESWKKLLIRVKDLIAEFDAKALVIGLPLESDGSESEMSTYAREMARKFGLSLEIPIFLQDERVTSYEAKARLWERGVETKKNRGLVDSEAAAIILADFLDRVASTRR